MALSRALRVVSGVGGTLKSAGLEAPFVGRERELKLIKELFHGSAQDRRAHLVSVTGIAGIGKSRLAWEFYKYFDGIIDQVYWHRGRCLAYGEGVAYWALADMVRMRCRIAEDEDPASARQKLRATLEEHLLDPEERAFVEPRLAHLLGLDEAATSDRQDLFAAWRLFFERLADVYPTVLAFEDMHWADTSLLDFVEHLLEWSRDYPIYVITLARPEMQERRPSWGAGQRNFSSLYLEPLSQAAMEELLEGLVPGLPERLRAQILARAEGVPLYAVETVRMLLDRGLLVQEGAAYQPHGRDREARGAGDLARTDRGPPRRRLRRGAAPAPGRRGARQDVHPAALAALSGTPAEELEPLLSALVRKEVLGIQSDPRSPERGQYGFLQDLVRHVAYETLSKRERKTRHLAAADHLTSVFADPDEIAEVLASHYLAAFESAPEAEDAQAMREKASEMLARAGERAGSLGAPEEGQRYYEQAAALAEEPLLEAALLEQAGLLGAPAGRPAEGRAQLERAMALFEEAAETRQAARASAALADIDVVEGRLEQAAARLQSALPALEQAGPSSELAATLAQLGRVQALRGGDAALGTLEQALRLAERLGLEEVLVQALTSKAIILLYQGRFAEGRLLLEGGVERARLGELHHAWFRAAGNLGVLLQDSDRHLEVLELVGDELAAQARQLGNREQLTLARLGSISSLFLLGRWAEALARADEADQLGASEVARSELIELVAVRCEQGDLAAAEDLMRTYEWARDAEQPEYKCLFTALEARLHRAQGRADEALAIAERGLALRGELPITNTGIKRNTIEALEAAFALGDLAKAEELLGVIETLRPGELTPFLRGHRARFRARLDAQHGRVEGIDESFRSAGAVFREFGFAFYLAVTELEHAEWLTAQGRSDEAQPLLDEASQAFEQLQATPWLERAAQVTPARREAESAIP